MAWRARMTAAGWLLSTMAAAMAQNGVGDWRPAYPEGSDTPRSLTPAERAWLETHPRGASKAVTSPPSGPVHCAAEYEPMDGILVSWDGTSGQNSILAQMSALITTVGDADVYCVVDTAGEQSTASSSISAAGANMARVKFVIRTTDTIWIRDYGPRYIFEGDCRAIVDHTYNRPRPNDDAFSSYFATYKHHAFYQHQLTHGGGNFHLDALDRSYVSRLINNENPTLTETQIHDIWQSYQNVDTTFFTPFPTSVDSTQHIDMWMQVIADNKVILSDWPNNAGSTQDNICDSAATFMAGRGYTVYRTPARSLSGVHYTYTNVVMCNGIVMIPTYSNTNMTTHNTQALAAFQTALPGKTIYQVNGDALVTSAGVMHCVVMHIPEPRGGVNPTVYLKNYRGGQVLTPGSQIAINWISDDDVGVSNVDILLSTDGGATYPSVVVAATADDGAHSWTVPNIWAKHARLRIVARDAQSHTGQDQSDADFRINGPPSDPGDTNCDGTVNPFDIGAFLLAMTDPGQYQADYPDCSINNADTNGDGTVNPFDIQAFLQLLGG